MKKLLLAVTVLAALTSCKKDKDETCELSAASIVGSYKTVSIKYKASAAAPEIDEFATYDACEKDDLVRLNANNTVDYVDAGISCSPSTNDTGTWALSGNTLTFDNGQVFTVTAFDCNGMTLLNQGFGGEQTTIVVTR